MKSFIKTVVFIAALVFVLVPGQILRADDDNSISFQTFYDQLSDQGTWIQTNDYGYVFQPTVNDPNWRPYTYGHWVNTDQGMMWVSNEPFGWATYHYGRWVNLDNDGWVWVPGYTWAPAWVSWRDSDDYYGWAPLPPDSAVGVDFFAGDIGFGFHIGDDCDRAFGIGPAWYNFCPVAFIGDPYSWRHFADRRDNFAIINRTRNITNINVANDTRAGRFGRVQAGGPSLAAVNARSRTPIQQVQLTSASTRATNGRLHGKSLAVFAPNVDPNTVKAARPHSVGRTLATTNVNRGTDINHSLTVRPGVQSAAPTAEQVHAAALAQQNGSTNAKIATVNTHPSRSLTQPLTSFHANTAARINASSSTTVAVAKPSTAISGNASSSANLTHHTTTSSTSNESRFTGESITHHTPAPTVAQPNRYTGEPAMHHVSHLSHSYSTSSNVHPFTSSGSSYHPQSVFHRSSAPAFHSQPSFHATAPTQHFGGAPAAHFSGGGGAAHASSGNGGGHSGGGDKHP